MKMKESSNWKRPCEIMKLRHREKKKMQSKNAGQGTSRNRDYKNEKSYENLNPKRTRRNPFDCSIVENVSLKRSTVSENEEKVKFLKVLTQIDNKLLLSEKSSDDNIQNSVNDCISLKPVIHKNLPPSVYSFENLPIDWSLKTTLRFISGKSFSWCCNLKTVEEAVAISSFVRCERTFAQNVGENTTNHAFFKQHCMYWIHPNLPWIRLFPRMNSTSKLSQSFLESSDIRESLLLDWKKSFRSVFLLLRARLCPYFYICTDTFTVLFRAAGIAGIPHIQVFVTPTTRGFRSALQSEEIDYSMPLTNSSNTFSSCESKVIPNLNKNKLENTSFQIDENDDRVFQDDAASASSWIESMGLDKTSFPSLNPVHVKLQKENFRLIDHKPESTIYIEGPEKTQAFFNFLLNCKSSITNIGPMTGVPPTILSPVSFEGASLQFLQIKEGLLHHEKKLHSLELTGPILPHIPNELCRLFQNIVKTEFTLMSNSQEATESFNKIIANIRMPGSLEQLRNCGLSMDIILKLCNQNNFKKMHEIIVIN